MTGGTQHLSKITPGTGTVQCMYFSFSFPFHFLFISPSHFTKPTLVLSIISPTPILPQTNLTQTSLPPPPRLQLLHLRAQSLKILSNPNYLLPLSRSPRNAYGHPISSRQRLSLDIAVKSVASHQVQQNEVHEETACVGEFAALVWSYYWSRVVVQFIFDYLGYGWW